MKSPIVKRSIVIAGHKTSVSLEDAFWSALKEIAKARHLLLCQLVAEIDHARRGNLSSAIRIFVFDYFRARIPPSSADRVGASMPNPAQNGSQSLSGTL